MSTAREIIDDAYASLGVSSELLAVDDALIDKALQYLISSLETLKNKYIILKDRDTGLTVSTPSALTDQLNEPKAARMHLVNYLAVHLVPISRAPASSIRVPPLPFSEGELWVMYGEQPIPIKVPSRTLPVGQGSKRHRRDNYFNGQELSKDVD